MRVVLKYEIEDACCNVLGHNQGQQGMTKDADTDVLDRAEEAKPATHFLKMSVGNWSKLSLKLCPETNIKSNYFKETEKAKQGTTCTACDQGSGAQAHLQRYSTGATFEHLLG